MKKSISSYIIISISVLVCIVGCSSETDNNEIIIAKINDKTISQNEFLRRSEYTIRPSYCKSSSNIDKQIVLNSLIAEKLFSIEAEKSGSKFQKSKDVQLYLQGRKEQAMRQVLYNDEVVEKVRLDNLPTKKFINYANRVYDLSYISIMNADALSRLDEELNVLKMDFDTLLTEFYNLKEIPHKEVMFNSKENQVIIDALYTQDLKKGSVLGPIEISNDHHMFLKVNGWTETPAITNDQKVADFKKVQEVLELRERKTIYRNYIQNVMKNKNIEFNRDVFFKFTDLVAPIYLKTKKEKEDLFLHGIWGESIIEDKYQNITVGLKELSDELILNEAGNDWTVGKLMTELKKHPLTFRKNNIPNKEFGFQLQLAIIDLVRDNYLTEIAYKKNIDSNPDVVRNVNMWKDNLNALEYKYNYLKQNDIDSLYNSDHIFVLENYLNGFVDSLQKKYSKSIYINVEKFNEIKLSHIQMVGTFVNSPFKSVVPTFPILTTSFSLDYGNKLKE